MANDMTAEIAELQIRIALLALQARGIIPNDRTALVCHPSDHRMFREAAARLSYPIPRIVPVTGHPTCYLAIVDSRISVIEEAREDRCDYRVILVSDHRAAGV